MLIASIILFALALYFTGVLIANIYTQAARLIVLGLRPKEERPQVLSIALVEEIHLIVVVLLWTAFYAVRVYS